MKMYTRLKRKSDCAHDAFIFHDVSIGIIKLSPKNKIQL